MPEVIMASRLSWTALAEALALALAEAWPLPGPE